MAGSKAIYHQNMQIVQEKLQNEPKNYVFKLLKNAVLLEYKGNNKEALAIYTRCQHDGFAQERMKALSRYKLLINQFDHLDTRLTTEEEIVLKSVKTFLKRPYTLTQEALMKKLRYTKDKIAFIIENLQFKGYLYRPYKEYKHLEVLRELDGTKASTVLLFSFRPRQLTTIKPTETPQVMQTLASQTLRNSSRRS
ncbi:hypothetical protein [Candidatus Berkiella aquae]|uniref:Uncharacterized protein n=1 Tax=Candidatus Berkiella aquae TaxID=295108 RepID=A0A0Q9YMC8_9GAMM|nr:hypothetical protein [Candidatus Berkiella aquae]MCS5710393.1 hypothetical protein [Candidatus Berkiella aquae]